LIKIFYHLFNIMSIIKDLQKNIKTHHFLAFLGFVILAYAIFQYSGRKGSMSDGFSGNASNGQNAPMNKPMMDNVAQPAEPAGQNEVYSSVSGISTSSQGLPPSCMKGGSVVDPSELLPLDKNSQWAQLNPSGSNDFKNVNLLKAGYHAGIDTVGSSLRNANLQVRSEPPNPTSKVSPWMNTTIEPDLMRMPLEIGCGPQ
jgi:hypothetical protein